MHFSVFLIKYYILFSLEGFEAVFLKIKYIIKPVIRSSRTQSSIQRTAGGEMAVAKPVFEWTCEVITVNPGPDNPGEYGNTVSSVIWGQGMKGTRYECTDLSVK